MENNEISTKLQLLSPSSKIDVAIVVPRERYHHHTAEELGAVGKERDGEDPPHVIPILQRQQIKKKKKRISFSQSINNNNNKQ